MLNLTISATSVVDSESLQQMIDAQKAIELKKLDIIEKAVEGVGRFVAAAQEIMLEEAKAATARAETARIEAQSRHLEIEERIAAARAEVAREMANAAGRKH